MAKVDSIATCRGSKPKPLPSEGNLEKEKLPTHSELVGGACIEVSLLDIAPRGF